MKNKVQPNLLILVAFLLAAAVYRVAGAAEVAPWAQYTPLGAMALFAGAYFTQSWVKYLLPMFIFFATELFINGLIHNGQYGLLHDSWYITYTALIGLVVLGHTSLRRVNAQRVAGTALAGGLLYWAVVDFGYWATGGLNIATNLPLERSFAGLMQSYVQGWPFAKNFLLGTLVFSGVLFGGYTFFAPKARMATQTA